MIKTIILCIVCFVAGLMIGMGTLLFIQGAFYLDKHKDEK